MDARQLEGGGTLALHDPWLSGPEAAELFAALRDEVPWKHQSIVMFGASRLQPRLTAWFGDAGTTYTYSGLTLAPTPWTPRLAALRACVEEAAGQPFNSVLLNLYRDGADSMGFHSDDEPELGVNPVIASVSLGAARRFVLQWKGKGVPSIELELGGGSLLVMGGATQHRWRHGVPKQRGAAGARINLTFRRILGDHAPALEPALSVRERTTPC